MPSRVLAPSNASAPGKACQRSQGSSRTEEQLQCQATAQVRLKLEALFAWRPARAQAMSSPGLPGEAATCNPMDAAAVVCAAFGGRLVDVWWTFGGRLASVWQRAKDRTSAPGRGNTALEGRLAEITAGCRSIGSHLGRDSFEFSARVSRPWTPAWDIGSISRRPTHSCCRLLCSGQWRS